MLSRDPRCTARVDPGWAIRNFHPLLHDRGGLTKTLHWIPSPGIAGLACEVGFLAVHMYLFRTAGLRALSVATPNSSCRLFCLSVFSSLVDIEISVKDLQPGLLRSLLGEREVRQATSSVSLPRGPVLLRVSSTRPSPGQFWFLIDF